MPSARTFAIGEHDFLLDGEPYRILSGAIHYFRVHPDQWRDRIRKARMMGLNTIETYIAWNFHSHTRAEFATDGWRDLGRFLDIVADEGMFAIVRPGPYICAEWANGGLPTWLTADHEMRLRSSDPRFLAVIEQYINQIAPIIAPRAINAGGPIILMQVENEYGAYGNDKEYMARLVEFYRAAGFSMPLTTVDQPFEQMLEDGRLDGLHMTGSFGSRSPERLATLRRFQPTGPLMCSEYWDGWFDSWGTPHHVTSVAESARDLDALLASGASVNLYMFHGGTNFGLTNGANHKGIYQPIVTSYDYDATLAEDGTPTEKYWAFREVIGRYSSLGDEAPGERTMAPTLSGPFDSQVEWRSALVDGGTEPTRGAEITFDELQHEGFLLYRHEIAESGDVILEAPDVRDRAQVFLAGGPIGVLQRDNRDTVLALPRDAHGTLEVLVEDLGRINYADRIGEWKGLGPVRVNGRALIDWQVEPVLLDPDRIAAALAQHGRAIDRAGVPGPVVVSGGFDLAAPSDLFLSTAGWGKGIAWINGFCLGRYWSRGPQATLYVPQPVVRAGNNTITLFELTGLAEPSFSFVAEPYLGATEL